MRKALFFGLAWSGLVWAQGPYPDPWGVPGLNLPAGTSGLLREALGNVQFPEGFSLEGSLLPLIFASDQVTLGNGFFQTGGFWEATAPFPDLRARQLPGQPLDGYACLQVQGHACRVPESALPLKLYSNFPRRRVVLGQAMAKWNRESQARYGRDFFVEALAPEQADIQVDFAGLNVPAGSSGVTRYRISRRSVEIQGISVRDDGALKDGELVEVVAHELGHCLGLDHSLQEADLMFYRRTGHHARPEAPVSQRDGWMFGWLYSQKIGIALLGKAPLH